MKNDILNLSVENIDFVLSLMDKEKQFYWRIKIDEGDNNPVYYGDYCSNQAIFDLYKKLEKYFEDAKYTEVTNTVNEKYYVLED